MSSESPTKSKARKSFTEAKLLYEARNFNGAANRAYYALYQAITATFEEMKLDQAKLTSKVTADEAGKWLHETVRNNPTLAGVDRKDSEIVRTAWSLRRKADYRPDDVTELELMSVMVRIPRVLKSVGVDVYAPSN